MKEYINQISEIKIIKPDNTVGLYGNSNMGRLLFLIVENSNIHRREINSCNECDFISIGINLA